MTTILIVDDDINCALLWARVLSNVASKFLFALTLEEAFEKMGEIPPPDLVLLDLKLPPYKAKHTLSAVNSMREFNPDLKVIAVSGMSPAEIDEEIKKAGVVIQAAVSKNLECQSNLLRVVQGLLADGKKPSVVLDKISEAIEKKTTDRIQLP